MDTKQPIGSQNLTGSKTKTVSLFGKEGPEWWKLWKEKGESADFAVWEIEGMEPLKLVANKQSFIKLLSIHGIWFDFWELQMRWSQAVLMSLFLLLVATSCNGQ
jgi:hypothetical protein